MLKKRILKKDDATANIRFKRKTILVNKYYQLKESSGMAGLVAFCLCILYATSSGVLVYNNHTLSKAMMQQIDLQKVQEDILKSIEMLSQYGNRKNLIFEAYKAIGDLKKNTDALKESNELLKRSIAINEYLMWINGILGIALVFTVFIISIRRTHRVAGPMFLLKRYMNEIIDGKIPDIRSLRKEDEFKDVFDTFVKMVDALHLNRRKAFKNNKVLNTDH